MKHLKKLVIVTFNLINPEYIYFWANIFHKKLFFTSFIILLNIGISNLIAQQSIVPSYHPVYDWLYTQRVNGFIPSYSYETLPHRRVQILEQLIEIEKQETELSKHDLSLLTEFLKEFDHSKIVNRLENDELREKNFSKSNLIKPYLAKGYQVFDVIQSPKTLKHAIKNRDEFHLFQFVDSIFNMTVDLGLGFGYWVGKEDTSIYTLKYNNFPLQKNQSPFNNVNIRVYTTFFKNLGFHFENLSAEMYQDDAIRKYHPLLTKNWKLLSTASHISNHTEGYTTFGIEGGDISIGRGLQKLGIGMDNNLAFSRESPAINWMRLKYSNSWFTAMHMHGSLTWDPTSINSGEDETLTSRKISPERWVAYQRIEFRPFSFIQLGWFEIINYSERSMDFAYMNIANRLFFMEWENQDRDNGWLGADVIIRPYKGIELYAEVLLDDLGGSPLDVFNFSNEAKVLNNKFARRFGITLSHSMWAQLNVDYIRIDPNIYSHKNLFNAHTEKGFPLGSQVGPNGDRWSFDLKKWLSMRSYFKINYSYNRQGLNIYEGSRFIRNVGSNPNISYSNDYTGTFIFLDGDRQEFSNIQLDYIIEPYRSIQIKSRIRHQWTHMGSRIPNYTYGELIVTIGMNYF